MIKIKMKNKINNQGQVLLIVIVAMAITLGVGLGITSRSTDSLKRTGNLDSLQKVTAAAEGGLEKYLLKNDSELESLVLNPSPSGESVVFANGTTSLITINTMSAGELGMNYEKIKVGESVAFLTTEFSAATSVAGLVPSNTCVSLTVNPPTTSYLLTVITSNPNVNLNYFPVENPAETVASPVDKTDTNEYKSENYLWKNGGFDGASPATCNSSGFQGYSLTNSYMLRFQPLSNEVTNLNIKSNTPAVKKIIQGFKLVSQGKFTADFSSDKTTRTIEAYKYLDTSSPIFDYALFLDN